MRVKKDLIIRFSIYAFVLLIISPLIFTSLMNIHYVWGFRASFMMMILFKLILLSCLLLFMIIWNKLKSLKKILFSWKEILIFGSLALLLLIASFYTSSDIGTMTSVGIDINEDIVNYDGDRFLGIEILSDKSESFFDAIIETENISFKKELNLETKAVNNKKIIMHGKWLETNRNKEFDSQVFLEINNNTIEITEYYKQLASNELSWFEIEVPKEYFLKGKNQIIVRKTGIEDKIVITSQDVYQEMNSFISKDLGETWDEHWRNLFIEIKEEKSFAYKTLFKLGFLFRIIGIILLFITIFGLDFSKFILRTSWKELIFSTIFAYWVYWFSEYVKNLWFFFSKIVSDSIYFLFKLFGFQVFSRVNPEGVPIIGIKGFIAGIYDVCSGVDSMGFFILAYFLLIAFYWNKISIWRAILTFFIGLIGIFILNILRVFLLILIGAKISKDFALNAFHTNAGMVFAIIYFIIFLPLALKFIEKKQLNN